MTSIGSDPDALDRLARALASVSGQLDGVARRLDGALARTPWDGTDGERFRRSWHTVHRRRLRTSADRCRDLARDVARHADEQRRASISTGAPTAASRLDPRRDATIHTGGISASIGPVGAALAGTLTVEAVGDRRRVTYSDTVQVSAGATVGRGVDAHIGALGGSSGASAVASAAVENTVRRTWLVDADEVTSLLVALAVEQGLTHVPGGIESRALSQGARVLDALTDAVGVDLPEPIERLGDGPVVGAGAMEEPVRSEDLLGVALSASALVAIGVGAAPGSAATGGGLGATIRAGTATEGRDSSFVLEAEGAVAASVADGLFGSGAIEPSTAAALRVEVPVGGSERPMLLTVTTGADERIVTRLAVDPETGSEVLDTARDALGRVMHGDPVGGLERLHRITLPPDAYQIDQSSERREVTDGAVALTTPVASVSVGGATVHRKVGP